MRRSEPYWWGHWSALSPITTVYRATGASGQQRRWQPHTHTHTHIFIHVSRNMYSPANPVLRMRPGRCCSERAHFKGFPPLLVAGNSSRTTLKGFKNKLGSRLSHLHACSTSRCACGHTLRSPLRTLFPGRVQAFDLDDDVRGNTLSSSCTEGPCVSAISCTRVDQAAPPHQTTPAPPPPPTPTLQRLNGFCAI